MISQDELGGLVQRGRTAAERLMLDSCRITRPGEVVTDPVTGKDRREQTPVYDGKCKVQQTIAQSSSPEAGGHQYSVQDSAVHVPVGVGPVAVGDVVTMTSSQLDPALVGNVYRVTETFEKSLATAQRLRVEEVTS